jgi:NADPH-dependent stearoyl-CoA 9-desaturase
VSRREARARLAIQSNQVKTLDESRLLQFQQAVELLQREAASEMGAADVAHLESIRTLSRRLELLGGALLHFSFEPLTFASGVTAIWAHKCLERMEIGHAVTAASTHGAQEVLTESLWGTAARALDWGPLLASTKSQVRDTARVLQQHAAGGAAAKREKEAALHHRLHATALGYLAKAVLLVPPLTRPFFWKVALGTLIAEVGRDVLQIAMTRAGRIDLTVPLEGRLAAQPSLAAVESARDVELPLALSILCGALDRRVEHHLFPRLPPQRLRQLTPRVKALCAEFGVLHRSLSLTEAAGTLLAQRLPR